MEKTINCLRCNRRLKTVKSRELGFGPVCYKKHLQEQADKEFKKNQTTIDEYLGDEHNATNDRLRDYGIDYVVGEKEVII